MMKKICLCILGLVCLAMMSVASALDISNPANGFSINEANATLRDVYSKLEAGNALDNKLYGSIQKIKTYKEKAEACVKQGREQIKEIDGILGDQYLGNTIKNNLSDYQYLNGHRIDIAARAAACNIFVYKAQSLLDHYGEAIKLHVNKDSRQEVEPVWNVLDNNIIEQFDVSPEKLYQSSGLKDLTAGNYYGLFALLVLTLVISKLIYSYCRRLLGTLGDERLLTIHTVRMIKRYTFSILPLAMLAMMLHALLYRIDPTPVVVLLTYSLLMYFLAMALVNFLLYIPAQYSSQMLKGTVQHQIFTRFIVVATIILAGYVGALFLRNQELTQGFVDVVRTTYITILVISTFWLCWAGFKLRFLAERKNTFMIFFLKLLLVIGLIALIIYEWLGYHQTTVFIIKGLVLTAFFFILIWGVVHLIERTFHVLEDSHYKVSQMLRRASDMKSHHDFIEFYMLRVALYIILACTIVIVMMHVWGVSLFNIDKVQTGMISGFPVLGITIYPLQIAAGFAVFSLIHMFGRFYSARIAKRNQYYTERERQVAIASVINYVAFAIALIAGLLVAGVNFTGLAIIAGALSVGIGFGLQNIANNFLSGLILLIQKPVKPGDRVVVGGTEGFISKIRVLQTQIKTLSREDVIVPNSDLISQPVTNYMFRDSFWRVTCKVGVAYGSDTDLVKKLLLDAAAKHPDVLQDEPNSPVVLFKDFGDSALLFELWVIIRDVNKKYHVASDLNFAIDTIFRQHHVVIAFPQRDLHIKEIVQTKPNKVDEDS